MIEPNAENGLKVSSQIMVDKPQSVPAEKIGQAFGQVEQGTMVEVNRALAVFLGIA
jgi:mRNA interferase MazF